MWRRLLSRGAFVWVLVRMVATIAVVSQAGTLGEPTRPADALGLGGVIGVVLLTAALGRVDVWRRRERVLLTNLGVSRRALLVPLAAPPLAGEAALALMVAVLRAFA